MTAERVARIMARIYAVLAGLNGCAWIALGFVISGGGSHVDPGAGLTHMMVPGFAFLGLSVAIWRRAVWAMIATVGLVVAQWFFLVSPTPWLYLTHPANSWADLPNLPYLGVAALYAVLTMVYVVAARFRALPHQTRS